MGLDAHVCCNCYERGRVRSSPPAGCDPSVSDDGSLLCGSDDLKLQIEFDTWQHGQACEHRDGYLVTHYIGNVALVAFLREELGRWPDRFPMILSRIVYNGIHGGDFIPAIDVPRLVPEVEALAGLHCPAPEDEGFLRTFEKQMWDLVTAALRVSKPIAF